jgi:carbon monoxide dehydrogenase subunit G
MISIREQITIPAPPDAVWPLLSDPSLVASCIPGASLTKSGDNSTYQGTMRIKFGPTVAQFRGEAKLAYDHAARRCAIEGRGIDSRGASRANASGAVEATGSDTTRLTVEGNFTVTGPLETFANAGGVHLARAILAEFAENVAKLTAQRTVPATGAAAPATGETGPGAMAASASPAPSEKLAAAELGGGKLLWRAFLSWLRQIFAGRRQSE